MALFSFFIFSRKPSSNLTGNNPPQLVESNVFVLTRLKIPSINVDALVEYVGLTKAGAMDVPKSPDTVAWYDLGPRPGEVGNAVFAGHYGWKNGREAVFDDLDKVRVGDKIYVEDDKGESIVFEVKSTRIYDREAIAPEVFLSSNGIHLNLITCTGDWDKIENSHTKRLVVFADLTS